MASNKQPTHNAVIITNTVNKGKDDEKNYYEKVGSGWLKDTAAGPVMTYKFFATPANTDTITFFPAKDPNS